MVQSAQHYALFSTDLTERIVTWDCGAQQLFGWSVEEVIGREARFIFTPEDMAMRAPEAEIALAAAHGAARNERWHLRKDGSRFWGSGLIMTVVNDEGRRVGFQKIIRDRTAEKKTQDELAAAREEIERYTTELEQRVARRTALLNQAMAAMESFTYSTSHDLRTPLRSIVGFSELLLTEEALGATARDFARRIHSAALRMDRLITDLLTYSRISHTSLELRRIDLARVVAEVLDALGPEIRSHGGEVEVVDPLGSVIGHELLSQQAIENLVTNALKFVAEGVQPKVRIWTEPRDGHLRLWVEDNGIGIEPEHRDRIFDLFQRVHPEEQYPGTGVGLAIVKHSVIKMCGQTGCESTPGKGSRFWIEWPTAPALPEDAGADLALKQVQDAY